MKMKPRFRLVRVLVTGISCGITLSLLIGFFVCIRDPEFQRIRHAWLAERPLVEQLSRQGARFNETIWWAPENGEAPLIAWAYKHYRQVQHIRFSKPDVSSVPFSRLKEFEHLESVDLSDTNIRADQLAQMRRKEWVRIDLCRTKITTEGLHNLDRTNDLTYLSLAGSDVTDEMLDAIKDSMIITLSLDDTRINDAGMASIAKMPHLQSLSLARTKIGDEGLRFLSQTRCSDLNLSGTALTDKGLTYVLMTSPGTMPSLNLSNTHISDEGMKDFTHLGYFIDALNLANTQITDAGLENLKGQRYMRWLCVGGTRVTPGGVDSLLKARQQQKDAWKTQHPPYTGEPPDLVVVTNFQTDAPRAYPTD